MPGSTLRKYGSVVLVAHGNLYFKTLPTIGVATGRELKGGFWDAGCVRILNLGGYTSVFGLRKLVELYTYATQIYLSVCHISLKFFFSSELLSKCFWRSLSQPISYFWCRPPASELLEVLVKDASSRPHPRPSKQKVGGDTQEQVSLKTYSLGDFK